MNKQELKAKAQALKPVVSIGKSGISENLIENITKNLAANKLTKIKIQSNILDAGSQKEDLINQILEATKAELVDKIGNVIVLWKR